MYPKRILNSEEVIKKYRDSDATIESLKREYHCAYHVLKNALLAGMSVFEYESLRHAKLMKGGMKTRFKPGQAAWNKNIKGIHYSRETEFIKGHLPANHKPVGTITIHKDKCGKRFRYIKVSGLKQGQHKWVPYAKYVYEKTYGPVPRGMFVIHKDGKTLNDAGSNLLAVNRRQHFILCTRRDPKTKERRMQAFLKAAHERKKNGVVKKQISNLKGKVLCWWECNGCGFETNSENPSLPCPKCGGLSFERLEQPQYISNPEQNKQDLKLICVG